jgi:hypothetical protein
MDYEAYFRIVTSAGQEGIAMGISLTQCHQYYTHMDMELKRVLRSRLLKYAPMYSQSRHAAAVQDMDYEAYFRIVTSAGQEGIAVQVKYFAMKCIV